MWSIAFGAIVTLGLFENAKRGSLWWMRTANTAPMVDFVGRLTV